MTKNWFNLSAAVILLITGSAKIISAFGHATILQRMDPIFPIQFNHLMFAAGTLELLVAAICFFDKLRVPGHFFTAWLATSFLIYRIGLWWIGWRRPCHCLGDFGDAIGISSETADAIMKGVLAYLLMGSYASLFWLWRQRNRMHGVAATQSA
ncbi:MAG TPA: MauE/DoxX family redox-associated membrane protein [Candidatus Angelobacter sp.]|nr:MauE/DoxX family redox-associated membrane protein [Candidatus Angelobacter sp.]